jgi:cytoskeletal protein RodZ
VDPDRGDGRSLGETLRVAREAKGYTLEALTQSLRIRKRYLEAIEEDRFTDLPPRPYPQIFLTSYARLAGLNPADVLDRYYTATGEVPHKVERLWEEADEEVPEPRSRNVVWIAVAAAVAVLIVVVILYRI